jgi:hypothetical protein
VARPLALERPWGTGNATLRLARRQEVSPGRLVIPTASHVGPSSSIEDRSVPEREAGLESRPPSERYHARLCQLTTRRQHHPSRKLQRYLRHEANVRSDSTAGVGFRLMSHRCSWGAISREGLKIYSVTLDTLGLYARSVADLQLLCKVFQLADDIPPPTVPKPLSESTFAYIKTDQWDARDGPSPELLAAWDKSKALLVAAGAKVIDVDLPAEFDRIQGHRNIHIMNGEGRVNFLAEYMIGKDKMHESLVGHVENTKNITRRQQLDAYDTVDALRPVFDKIASQYDAVITPSVPAQAPMGIESTGDARFCGMWTALHVPCVNVPGFASDEGAPIGLTLIGPR